MDDEEEDKIKMAPNSFTCEVCGIVEKKKEKDRNVAPCVNGADKLNKALYLNIRKIPLASRRKVVGHYEKNNQELVVRLCRNCQSAIKRQELNYKRELIVSLFPKKRKRDSTGCGEKTTTTVIKEDVAEGGRCKIQLLQEFVRVYLVVFDDACNTFNDCLAACLSWKTAVTVRSNDMEVIVGESFITSLQKFSDLGFKIASHIEKMSHTLDAIVSYDEDNMECNALISNLVIDDYPDCNHHKGVKPVECLKPPKSSRNELERASGKLGRYVTAFDKRRVNSGGRKGIIKEDQDEEKKTVKLSCTTIQEVSQLVADCQSLVLKIRDPFYDSFEALHEFEKAISFFNLMSHERTADNKKKEPKESTLKIRDSIHLSFSNAYRNWKHLYNASPRMKEHVPSIVRLLGLSKDWMTTAGVIQENITLENEDVEQLQEEEEKDEVPGNPPRVAPDVEVVSVGEDSCIINQSQEYEVESMSCEQEVDLPISPLDLRMEIEEEEKEDEHSGNFDPPTEKEMSSAPSSMVSDVEAEIDASLLMEQDESLECEKANDSYDPHADIEMNPAEPSPPIIIINRTLPGPEAMSHQPTKDQPENVSVIICSSVCDGEMDSNNEAAGVVLLTDNEKDKATSHWNSTGIPPVDIEPPFNDRADDAISVNVISPSPMSSSQEPDSVDRTACNNEVMSSVQATASSSSKIQPRKIVVIKTAHRQPGNRRRVSPQLVLHPRSRNSVSPDVNARSSFEDSDAEAEAEESEIEEATSNPDEVVDTRTEKSKENENDEEEVIDIRSDSEEEKDGDDESLYEEDKMWSKVFQIVKWFSKHIIEFEGWGQDLVAKAKVTVDNYVGLRLENEELKQELADIAAERTRPAEVAVGGPVATKRKSCQKGSPLPKRTRKVSTGSLIPAGVGGGQNEEGAFREMEEMSKLNYASSEKSTEEEASSVKGISGSEMDDEEKEVYMWEEVFKGLEAAGKIHLEEMIKEAVNNSHVTHEWEKEKLKKEIASLQAQLEEKVSTVVGRTVKVSGQGVCDDGEVDEGGHWAERDEVANRSVDEVNQECPTTALYHQDQNGTGSPLSPPSRCHENDKPKLSPERGLPEAAVEQSGEKVHDAVKDDETQTVSDSCMDVHISENTKLFVIADSGCFGKAKDILTLRPHAEINDDVAVAVAFQLLLKRYDSRPDADIHLHRVLPSYVVNQIGNGFGANLSVFPELDGEFMDRGTFYLISFSRSLAHGWLTVIDFSNQSIKTYDSLNHETVPVEVLQKLEKAHSSYNTALKKGLHQKYAIDESAWTVQDCESQPQGVQDCVVISLKNMEALINEENPMTFVNPRRGSSYRKQFVALLLNTTEVGRVLLKRFNKDIGSLLTAMELICDNTNDEADKEELINWIQLQLHHNT